MEPCSLRLWVPKLGCRRRPGKQEPTYRGQNSICMNSTLLCRGDLPLGSNDGVKEEPPPASPATLAPARPRSPLPPVPLAARSKVKALLLVSPLAPRDMGMLAGMPSVPPQPSLSRSGLRLSLPAALLLPLPLLPLPLAPSEDVLLLAVPTESESSSLPELP